MQFNLRRSLLAATVAVAALALPATGAQAAAIDLKACDDAALSKPFRPWGDVSNYKLAPQGSFERGAADWDLSRGASVGAGSEPWDVTGVDGASALTLSQGASAVSPASCVNAGAPTFRFFARSTGGLLPLLRVDLVYRQGPLSLLSLPIGVVTGGNWKPSVAMLTASFLPAALANQDVPLSLRFTAMSGSWQVDDVYVDPYSRG
jgi:hypothetical protein